MEIYLRNDRRCAARGVGLVEHRHPRYTAATQIQLDPRMQTATWLTRRELAEAAGSWDTRLHFDDDGEYFCRVLLASEGTRFIPEARVYYRMMPSSCVRHIGASDRKKEALVISMKLHIRYLRSLAESERVRKTCLDYLQIFLRPCLSGTA